MMFPTRQQTGIRRLLCVVPIALLTTLALFLLMVAMVDHPRYRKTLPIVERDAVPARIQPKPKPKRHAIEKPLKTQVATQPQSSHSPQRTVPPTTPLLLPPSNTGQLPKAVVLSGHGPKTLSLHHPSQWLTHAPLGLRQTTPLKSMPPRYPPKAIARKIEGYVILQFAINHQGRAVHISVASAEPEGIFEAEAMRALKRWRYPPADAQPSGEYVVNESVRIEFNLD